MLKIRRKCRFTSKLREKYPFLEETKTKGIVVCRCCGARISIESGGNSDIVRHLKSKKHQDAVSANESITFHYRSKSDPVSTEDVPFGDDVLKEDATTNQQENENENENGEFETHWFDSEAATESDSTTASNSPLHSDQEQKHIPHLSQSVSAPPKISRNRSQNHSQTVDRNKRTLSVQRMKMFEAELRVWQRKGEAIVKLMETVGQDKEMWEIINKQSRLHERERDRIREEYDIL